MSFVLDIDCNVSDSISKLEQVNTKPQYENEKMPAIKYTNYIDIVAQLREIIHKLQLKDAIQRQEISKLKKKNGNIRKDAQNLEGKIHKLEKARHIVNIFFKKNKLIKTKDNQYLIKVDNQLLNDKRQRSGEKKAVSQERSISANQDKKMEELSKFYDYYKNITSSFLDQTVQGLTNKIKTVTDEKSKLEDVIKNLLFEKELHKLIVSKEKNSDIDTISQNSPKFLEYKLNSNPNVKYDQITRISSVESKINMEENFGSTNHTKLNESLRTKEYSAPKYSSSIQKSNHNTMHNDITNNLNLNTSNLSNTNYNSSENSLNKSLGRINNQIIYSNFSLTTQHINLGSPVYHGLGQSNFTGINLGNNISNIPSNNSTLVLGSPIHSGIPENLNSLIKLHNIETSALNNSKYNEKLNIGQQHRTTMSFNNEFENTNNDITNTLEISPSIIDIGTNPCNIIAIKLIKKQCWNLSASQWSFCPSKDVEQIPTLLKTYNYITR